MKTYLSGIFRRISKGPWFHFMLVAVVAIVFWFSLPRPLFDDPLSTVVYNRQGDIAGAHIASDGQWRFPSPDSIPPKFSVGIRMFEDEYFFKHPGINPVSLFRALKQDIKSREIVSGGSTISMQVIRLARKGKNRTLYEKLVEMILALDLELHYSKEEILNFYTANAPFGGNVVGLEAASWRYFGRDPFSLSWAESATLAVLPNAPALIHPGRNREQLMAKRNRLLAKLCNRKIIDSLTYELALTEPLPDQPLALPSTAYHLSGRYFNSAKGQKVFTTLDANIQERVNQILERHRNRLYGNQVHNAACIVTSVETGEVLAYVGNIRNGTHPEFGGDVDVIMSPRSSGSILKPFLFAGMLYRGEILPNTLIADIPTRFRGYSPKNYNREYDGAVPASEALARSLNVPAVRMLHQYGNERFHHDLREMGFTTIKYSPEHYGLSLILGGAEVTLWELAGVYSGMARVLNHYTRYGGKYFNDDWHMPVTEMNQPREKLHFEKKTGNEQGLLGAGSIWLTFEALREVHRPASESGWELFSSSRRLAWKTGTSFGFRDGWAVGITPGYVVAVWTGNADGEGRPGLTGLNTAAPLLFDIFDVLPETTWFDMPYDDLVKTEVCRQSGQRPSKDCPDRDSVWISPAGLHSPPCPYHHLVHLSQDGRYRVSSACYDIARMKHQPWFILPPAMEWYYRKSHPDYRVIPDIMAGCTPGSDIKQVELIYPDPGSIIYVPRELDGRRGEVIFEAALRHPGKKLFWSVDDHFIGQTVNFHQIAVQPGEGKHLLTLVDEDGNRLSAWFEVVEKE